MARAKKRATKKKPPTPKSKSKPRAKTKVKTKAKTKAKAKARPGSAKKTRAGKRGSDVDHRWKEYSDCRVALEEAVTAVREAEQVLHSARELERTRRDVFDRTKNTLKDLLEVEPASKTAAAARARPPSRPPSRPPTGLDFGPANPTADSKKPPSPGGAD